MKVLEEVCWLWKKGLDGPEDKGVLGMRVFIEKVVYKRKSVCKKL